MLESRAGERSSPRQGAITRYVSLNEILRRMRVVQCAGTLTFTMRDYLDLLKTRYERLLRQSSRAPSRASVSGTPAAGPAVLRHIRAGSIEDAGHVRIPFVLAPNGQSSSESGDICVVFEQHFCQFSQSEISWSEEEANFRSRVQEFCGALPSVPSHLQEPICAPVMATVLWEVLSDSCVASAPGPDGIPTGLYSFLPCY